MVTCKLKSFTKNVVFYFTSNHIRSRNKEVLAVKNFYNSCITYSELVTRKQKNFCKVLQSFAIILHVTTSNTKIKKLYDSCNISLDCGYM